MEVAMNSTRTLLVTLAASGLLVGAAATAGLLTAGNASAAGATPAAATPTPGPSQAPAPDDGRGRGGPFHGPGRLGGPGLGGLGLGGPRGAGQGPVLHGEFVTGGPNGATRTVIVQSGTVSAKAGSTITVTSTDGYKVVWTLDDSTRVRTGWSRGAVKDIAQGDTVLVEGTKSGSTTTAALVAERPKGAPSGQSPKGTPSAPGTSPGGTPSGA
jgi:hypothetical protein